MRLPAGAAAQTSDVAPPLRFHSFRPRLGLKLGLLLAAVFGVSVAALFRLQEIQRRAMAELLTSESRERSGMMEQVIILTARELRDFTSDYGQWDDMVTFINRPKRPWAAINIDSSVEKFNLSGAWVLRPNTSLVHATRGQAGQPPPPLPLPKTTLRALFSHPPKETFFLSLSDRLVELCLAPVVPSDDLQATTKPRGWFMAEKTWDAAQLQLISNLIQCETRITPPGLPLPASPPGQIIMRHPLRGPTGEVVADLEYTVRSKELEIGARTNRTILIVFCASYLVIAALAVGALYRWVLRPLRTIGTSLSLNDPTPIGPLALRSDEMGRLARLVETSFAQRTSLERNLAERTRLGRELHDGAIQTVYAVGMSLNGVRDSLRTNPAQAEGALDEIRTALNTTIRDLRTFIDELEPEQGAHPRFGEALRSIFGLMQGVRPIGFSLVVDDAFADQLNEKVRLHLLQIVRECASNCVRHSHARKMQVVLRRDADAASLEISDDGGGIESTPEIGEGRGLANLAERTRELGGTLKFESNPGTGLRIHLTFPCAPNGQI